MLYREWFVNFRFPGHEKVRMVESELGPIPEGWSHCQLLTRSATSSVVALRRRQSQRIGTEPIPFFGTTDAPDDFDVVSTSKSITRTRIERNAIASCTTGETVFITARANCWQGSAPGFQHGISNQSCYALRA